jgi:hypothetical protein
VSISLAKVVGDIAMVKKVNEIKIKIKIKIWGRGE